MNVAMVVGMKWHEYVAWNISMVEHVLSMKHKHELSMNYGMNYGMKGKHEYCVKYQHGRAWIKHET
jgi:hypothetical protein